MCRNAGKPPSGSLHEQKNKARNNARKHLNLCRAKAEHSKLQKMDKQFLFKSRTMFRNLDGCRVILSKLRINEEVVTDQLRLRDSWVDHFSSLATSCSNSNSALRQTFAEIEDLLVDIEEYEVYSNCLLNRLHAIICITDNYHTPNYC